jgi:hypothetical protein
LAGKRKKSKARKKPKSQASKPEASAKDVERSAVEEPGVVHRPADEDSEVIDLTLDDELDDEGARERLIAEALAFVDGDEVEPEGEVGVAEADESAEAGVSAEADESAEANTSVEAGGKADVAPDRSTEIPKLTPAVLAALTAIHREGRVSLRGELVLDLGDATTEEERDRVLAAALAHAEMQEAIYRVPTDLGRVRRWKAVAAAAIMLLALATAVSPPGLVVPDPPASLADADRLYGIRVALLLQAQQIEAFRAREGRLPDSITEVARALPGIRFVKSSGRLYQLVAYAPDGEAIVYDSAAPAAEFEDVSNRWVTTREGS